VSFAIPINLASRIKEQIVAHGKVEHAKLGVAVQEVNQTLADSFGLDRPEGALVASVEKGSPADRAGLKSGDVIRSANGKRIVSSGDLPTVVGMSRPGEQLAMDVWRQGKEVHLTAELARSGDKASVASSGADVEKGARLGLALRPLEPQERQEAGVKGGVIVEDVAGPAQLAGVEPGDVVLAVNGTPVASVDQVKEAVAKSKKSVALLIQRGGDKIFVPIRLG
jgi:serine protease Do